MFQWPAAAAGRCRPDACDARYISSLRCKSSLEAFGSAMPNLRDLPIRRKITLMVMLITGAVLLSAFAALFYFQAYTLRQQSAHELAAVGEVAAHNCASAVMFKDEDAAAQILTG